MWAIFGLIVSETRHHAWNEAIVAAGNTAALVESAIARELEIYDLSIRAAAVASNDPTVLALPDALKRRVLFDDTNDATLRGQMLVIDETGRAVAASRDESAVGRDFSDRDYFRAHRWNGNAGLVIDGPFIGRLSRVPAIALSRRRPDRDGRFVGIVSGTIKIDFFTTLFNKVHLQRGSSISLLKRDGTILTRVPFQQSYLGLSAASITVDHFNGGASVGTFRKVAATDGVERLFSFHQVGDLPLFVNVGVSVSVVLAAWRWEMVVVAVGFGLLSAMIVAVGHTLCAELRRRSVAEQRLSELASTDHLTLLANRRRFDDVLDAEWLRGARSGAPLALLMLDCDHFKSYNDAYGHPAGDRALRAIAAALRLCVDGSNDLVARLGGEEFAALLPGTDEAGAMIVASALRAAMEALDLAHATMPAGRLTVSIGLACLLPSDKRSPATLVEAADAALYRAKRDGRDRIVRYAAPLDDAMRNVA